MHKKMVILRKWATIIISAFLLVALIPVPASATCSHTWKYYCDASHPHENYKICSLCHTTEYLETYTTKRHGNGSWGSGTCPDCGTCYYAGRSCTSDGVCVCGNTVSKYGHSDTLYCDATHTAGNGHSQFYLCSRCYRTNYTGTYIIKPHGPGTSGSGTCPQCGSHDYEANPSTILVHPHPFTMQCNCGDSYVTGYGMSTDCAECLLQNKEVSITESPPVLLYYFDGDAGMGTIVTFTVNLTMDYLQTYKRDGNQFLSMRIIYQCSIDASQIPVWAPNITLIASSEMKYFNSSGTLLFTNELTGTVVQPTRMIGIPFIQTAIPASSRAQSIAYVEGSLTTSTETLNIVYFY